MAYILAFFSISSLSILILRSPRAARASRSEVKNFFVVDENIS